MELERLELELRHRTPWEAADLGLPWLRRWRGPVYRAWFATFIPFNLLLFLALWRWPLVAAMVAWWCKPLFDRVLLKVYAEAAFGQPPGLGAVWRSLPDLCRRTGLVGALTWGRGDMARSFHLPVHQLERQRGKAAKSRRKVLGYKARGCAFWLTFLCSNFSACLQISIILLLELLWPSEAPAVFDWQALFHGDSGLWESLLSHLAWVFGESLVEPFYVAAGFALYLNRRNDLEGWDIELGFRQLARRVAAERRGQGLGRAAGLASLGLAGLLLAQYPLDGHAAEPTAASGPEVPPSPAKQAIQAVLADPVFGHKVEDWKWHRRDEDDGASSRRDAPDLAWLHQIVEWIAEGIRLFGYVAAAVLAGGFGVLLYRYRGMWPGRAPNTRRVPSTLFGLDVRPESLPEDIALAAGRLLDAGSVLPALSLLYRGALVALIHGHGVDFLPGDTEDDCRTRVRGRIDPGAEAYFAGLLAAWSLAAYAHATPPPAQLRALCADWPRHFAGRGAV